MLQYVSVLSSHIGLDIRKFKVLIEFFNKEEQCFAIKHTQDEASKSCELVCISEDIDCTVQTVRTGHTRHCSGVI